MSRPLRFVQPSNRLGEKVWGRALTILARQAEDRAREREAGAALLDELMALPAGERLPAVESEERFWTRGLLDELLAATERQSRENLWRSGETLRELAEISLALALRLDAHPDKVKALAEPTAVAWCLWADVKRRRGGLDEAERGFRAAVQRLRAEVPGEARAWAVYGRLAALLRWDQEWPAEALGLLHRAARLFDQLEDYEAAGEVLCEQGWLCLGEDPVNALDPLLGAVARLDPREAPQAGLLARYGLALCHASLGDHDAAQGLLAEVRSLQGLVPDPIARLRLVWMEARIVDCCGEAARAVSLLQPLVGQLLTEEAYHEAAIVAVDLAQLYAAAGRQGEIARLRREVAPLAEPGALPPRARSVLLFALRLAERRDHDWTELLSAAIAFLEDARENERRRFQPAAEPGAPELPWDLVELSLRRQVCEEAGLPSAAAQTLAAELSATERDLIAWTYEVVAQVRIVFEPATTGEGG